MSRGVGRSSLLRTPRVSERWIVKIPLADDDDDDEMTMCPNSENVQSEFDRYFILLRRFPDLSPSHRLDWLCGDEDDDDGGMLIKSLPKCPLQFIDF